MTDKKMKMLIQNLKCILMQPLEFNDLRIEVSYVSRAKHSKNWVINSHHHPWFEFNYVSKGSVFTKINDTEFLVSKGESYLIPPGINHSHRHNQTGDDGICIRFSVECSQPNNEFSKQLIQSLTTACEFSFHSNIDKMFFSESIYGTQAEFVAWLIRMSDHWCIDGFVSMPSQNTISSQVLIYLKEYYPTKVMVEDIANALNISYRSLSRRFKHETGVTILEKLTELRLNKAKHLLLSTDMSLHHIALKSGYENEYYFSKMFKKQERVSPSYYRKMKAEI